ncbi:MAG: hypothetical protein Q8896_03305 [Bacteroidota bacterium]|nr:hypothetical protein [Bacteroidota bacterium]
MRIIIFTFIALSCSSVLYAQTIPHGAHRGVNQVPIGEEVYSYLRHLLVRGLINNFSEAELPLSEYDIVVLLGSADTTKLSSSELALHRKFIQTYAREPYDAVTMFPADNATPLFFEGIPTEKDKYLYRWKDDSTLSDLQVHGLANLEFRSRTKPTSGHGELGLIGGRFTGTISGHVGFFMEATNGQSFGDTTIAAEDASIAHNKNFSLYSHTFFDNTSGELSYTYDWFTAKIAREALAFGGSYQGNNILISPDIQQPDFVTLAAHVGAVRYQVVVASILGEARFSVPPDSFYNAFGAGAYIDPKYLTVHDLTFLIGKDLEMGFTDMVIFSRRFDLAYINPFTFLKSVEASLNDRDNGLLGAHARWRVADGFELRGEGLVDDVVGSKIGSGFWSNKFAWQIGGMWAAPLGLRDVDIAFEHTRVEPFTYSHFNSQNTFSTSGQVLGAAIGPNSMSFWGQIRWTPSEKLTLEADITLVEHGENFYDSTGQLKKYYDSSGHVIYDGNQGGDFELSVTHPGDVGRSFKILDGNRVNSLTIDATASYELWRGLNFFVRGYSKSVDYVSGTPLNPREKPYGFFGIGARAIF